MKTFTDIYQILRHKNRKQYALLSGCLLFSALLIASYSAMMRSPTVLTVLPEGGDSRRQVMMIFVLTMMGCAVFSLYAAGLFLRQKSRDMGIFLALGMERRTLTRILTRELCALTGISCLLGMVLSLPITLGIWGLFRLLLVDTAEMALSIDPQAYLLPLAYSVVMTALLFLLAVRSLRRIDVMEIIRERHTSEPIHDIPRWYGAGGIFLLIAGFLLGYQAPAFFVLALHWYPPEGLTAIFYAPAFAGLYMILLHTVVNGWHKKKSVYKDIIATSQMKFEGRQTVRNLLVMSLLIAGAYFASFYTPMLGISSLLSFDQRPMDYVYRFRMDQSIPELEAVQELAKQYDVAVTDWDSAVMLRLAVDGIAQVETETSLGTTWESVYYDMVRSDLFLRESDYSAITGEKLHLAPGALAAVFDSEGACISSGSFDGSVSSLVTNPLTGRTLPVTSVTDIVNNTLCGHYIMSDADYEQMREGLTPEWKEKLCLFNVENCEESYAFAKALFHAIVDASDSSVALLDGWDPVIKMRTEASGEAYFLDPDQLAAHNFEPIDYDLRDSSNFRMYWLYMPQFRVLDKADFVKTTAVFTMTFVFIALVCFAAVFIIAYTRSMTLAINGRQLYGDLRRLGACDAYLFRTVRSQLKRVFLTPAVIGAGAIYALYAMIMFFNDNRLSQGELLGMAACLLLIAAVSGLFYGFYRRTLRKVCSLLNIHPAAK